MTEQTTPAAWVLVVTWSEPEDGMVAFGPFASEQAAIDSWPDNVLNFENEGELPDDVAYRAVELLPDPPATGRVASASWTAGYDRGVGDGQAAAFEGTYDDDRPGPLSGEWAGDSPAERIPGWDGMTDEQRDAACDDYEAGHEAGFASVVSEDIVGEGDNV